MGRRISKPGIEEVWTLGFLSFSEDEAKYVLISDQDGMVTIPKTIEGLVDTLNRGAYYPVELLELMGKRK